MRDLLGSSHPKQSSESQGFQQCCLMRALPNAKEQREAVQKVAYRTWIQYQELPHEAALWQVS